MSRKLEQPPGYLALPRGEAAGAVLVLHAWWGLNETTRSVCDRLAAEGYVAFAPDLYHGQIANEIPDAEALSRALDAKRATAEVAAAAKYLAERAGGAGGRIAVIGFSLGAYFALDLSAADPERTRCVVVFYGTGPADFGRARASYLGHFAGKDEFEPAEQVDALEAAIRAAGREVSFHRYEGTGHWFFEPDRTDAYNQPAADLAWQRTLAFLKERVAAGG